MSSNRLKMNPDKTEVAIFTSRPNAGIAKSASIKVAGDVITFSSDLKYLGVWLDSHLSMDKHIANKCKTAIHNIRCISNIRRFIDVNTAKMLATSLVLSHLDYSNSVLCGLPKKSLTKLQRVQNWAAKIVLQREKLSDSRDALKTLHWLPVKERIDFKILCLVYKCLNKQAPDYLASLLKVKEHQRTTRSSTNLGITLEEPAVRKSTFAARSFSVKGPQLWNAISVEAKSQKTFYSFKRSIKTFLFRRAYAT